MPKGKEYLSRDFAHRYGHSNLVADKDKYLFAREEPRYRFNVIGGGTMGQEHIRVTNFEGRAAINGSGRLGRWDSCGAIGSSDCAK